jgi:hypothetical protein
MSKKIAVYAVRNSADGMILRNELYVVSNYSKKYYNVYLDNVVRKYPVNFFDADPVIDVVDEPLFYVKCLTNEYRYLHKFKNYPVYEVLKSSYGNTNYKIKGEYNKTFSYWAGNFKKIPNVSKCKEEKIYRYTIKDQYGNIEYESDCINCINTYVENQKEGNHIC